MDWVRGRQEAGKPVQALLHHLRKGEMKTLVSVNIQEKGNVPVVALIWEEEKTGHRGAGLREREEIILKERSGGS